MDRNQIIGIALIIGLLYVWSVLNAPSKEDIAEQQRIQDSIARVEQQQAAASADSANVAYDTSIQEETITHVDAKTPARTIIGGFNLAAPGEEEEASLENELMKVTFSSRGGIIKSAELHQYQKIILNEENKEVKVPLVLLEDDNNIFEYQLPVPSAPGGILKTGDLQFEVSARQNTVIFTARGDQGLVIEQEYSIKPDSYALDYTLRINGVSQNLAPGAQNIQLYWKNYLDKLEVNYGYEKYYTSVYYRTTDGNVDYCSRRSDDTDEIDDTDIKWISHSNQFFNSALIANAQFGRGVMTTEMLEDESPNLKILTSNVEIPLSGRNRDEIGMQFYLGPNDFERLYAYDMDLQDIIPFGASIFGTINRWVIRPMFNFLSSFIGIKGIVILVLTLIVKALLYPLTYKMLYSQAKMGALKPVLNKMREKYKDDTQKQQMESMKVYREYGVSPLGGCLPMIAQMPIWFALYRFFPASIEFRQANFLWATDLSSYDVIAYLPFEIPFYGSHVSLFTLLWAVSILLYTFYNTRHMDIGTMNPMMKYMQYLMPVGFLFFFNSYASGLTLYLFYSNMLNVIQTITTKKFIFDEDKIRAELNKNKEKPKKKGGFQARLEQALKEQQRVAKEREAAKKKKK